MVRMIDVAKHADVSLKTVSRVLNNEPHVQEKIRKRVFESINELGYIPSTSARSLRSLRTYSIHLISNSIEGAFINTVQSGALLSCQKHGYSLLISLLDSEILNNPKALKKWCAEFVVQKRPDGVILVPPHSDNIDLNSILNEANIPISRIGPNEIIDKDNSTIMIDDRKAAREVTEYLISLGHKRIGHVRGSEDQGATHKRYSGYTDALKAASIPIIEELIKPGNFRFESGLKAGEELLKMKNRPTAIFAANDDMAAGIIVASYMNHFKVPDELSVIGFDDNELAKRIWPTLSTIQQPVFGYGERAAELLVKKAGTRKKQTSLVISATELMNYKFILRESTNIASTANN